MRHGALASAAALALALAGCSGGGGNPGECMASAETCSSVQPSPPASTGSAVGLYKGFTSGGNIVYALVLSTSDLWLLYDLPSTGTPVTIGAEHGTWSSSNTALSSSDLADFNAGSNQVTTGTLTGSFTTQSSLAGSVTLPSQSFTFSASYQTGFTTAGTLAAAAGTYTGGSAVAGSQDGATATVTTDGVVTGSTSRGCNFSGTLQANSGISTYSVSLTFIGAACPQTPVLGAASGVGVLDGTQLHLAVFNTAKTQGFSFSGAR